MDQANFTFGLNELTCFYMQAVKIGCDDVGADFSARFHHHSIGQGGVFANDGEPNLRMVYSTPNVRIASHVHAFIEDGTLDHSPTLYNAIRQQAMQHDKKIRKGRLVFVLLKGIGRPVIVDNVDRDEIARAVKGL